MELNAFVVMPFGKKSPRGFDPETKCTSDLPLINFDDVWKELLKPALERAGCRAFRADSEAAAGDIRTDMFFELITADLVVADISISNPNVFYELGVRHGVCPRGVFVVTGNITSGRAFDIAQDRSFAYDGKLFLCGNEPNKKDLAREKDLARAVRQLGAILGQAVAVDQTTVGSPVYSHLPGLAPVNWENIQTSRAQHFHALQDDWLDCVRKAQHEGRPGDILTLAEDAPTRLHRTKILYEAAMALINMCRYPAAERVLREVIASEPDSPKAQLQLARALSHQNKTEEAEHTLRSILRQHEDDPHAGDLLGQVFRHLWHLSWKSADAKEKTEKARDTLHLAYTAIASFIRAFRSDARAYYAGLNALILGALLRDIFPTSGKPDLPASTVDLQELATVIQFLAKNERERSIAIGDYTEQFWATTTLAGVALVNGDIETANDRVREACCIPGTTSFQLQSFRERLELLNELDFKAEFVCRALAEISAVQKPTHCVCERVVLYAGSRIEDGRITEPALLDLTEQIKRILEKWEIREGDLAICEGTTQADIVFAEECLTRGARTRLMILEPELSDSAMWPFENPEWLHRFHKLIRRDGVEAWFHAKHLGSAMLTLQSGSEDEECLPKRRRAIRHKQWILNTAKMEAARVVNALNPADTRNGSMYGLFVWDGRGKGDDPESPSSLIRDINQFDGYRGEVEIIRLEGAKNFERQVSFQRTELD